MTEEQNQNSRNNIKKIAEIAGKTALTIASPPIGLPTFFAKGKRFAPFLGGIVASQVMGLGLIVNTRGSVQINPGAKTYLSFSDYSPDGFGALEDNLLGLISPLGLYLNREPRTFIIESSKSTNQVQGRDVVQFNPEFNQYVLNFPTSKKFESESRGYISLDGFETKMQETLSNITERISEKESELETALNSGDINKARRANESLDGLRNQLRNTSVDFQVKYNILESEYNEVREDYLEIVDTLNREHSALQSSIRRRD